jgi:fumarate reductase flavoprotein subunit
MIDPELSRRHLLAAAISAAALSPAQAATRRWDAIIVGAGTAGLMAGLFGSARSARILILEAAEVMGGTLHYSSGQMSAAGTKVQAAKGIADTPDEHFADVVRISRGTADPVLTRLAIDHAPATYDWLMAHGFDMIPEHPVKGFAHEPYSKPRYYWGTRNGISILNVIQPQVEQLVARRKLTLLYQHKLTQLLQDNTGAVTGVQATGPDGQPRSFRAKSVLLATGGYNANPALYQQLSGVPLASNGAYPFSQGQGLLAAQAAGAATRGAEHYMAGFGAVQESATWPTGRRSRISHWPERRQPWEIYVNSAGQRFVREDIPSVDAREQALLRQPALRYWIILDEAMLAQAPPILTDMSREQMREAFAKALPGFHTAPDIAALAAKAGIEAGGLARTVELFNYGVKTGNDLLGRTHMPRPIATSPFYAVQADATNITSAVGVTVDARLRVLRADGSVIPNLYAAGEVLGTGALQGKAVSGGMMVTPALTFGRLLGERMLPL